MNLDKLQEIKIENSNRLFDIFHKKNEDKIINYHEKEYERNYNKITGTIDREYQNFLNQLNSDSRKYYNSTIKNITINTLKYKQEENRRDLLIQKLKYMKDN